MRLGRGVTDSNGDASVSFTVPGQLPAREYPLIAEISADAGEGTTTGVLNVTGGNAFEISGASNNTVFEPGETAEFTATVRDGDGAAAGSQTVNFVINGEGTAQTTVGSATTNNEGVATITYNIPASAGTSEYVLRTELATEAGIKSFSGYQVRDLNVGVTAEDGPFTSGETINLTVQAEDTARNDITATGGTVRLVLPGSNLEKSLSLSGSAPYDINISLPDDITTVGTRSIAVTIQKDATTDTSTTLVDVQSDTQSANLSVAIPVVAGQSTTVTTNGSLNTTAVLTAFSPDADSVTVNKSAPVNSSQDRTTSMTIDSPGTYIVKLSVPQVGTLTEIIEVESASGPPSLQTGPDVSSNATEFNKTEDVFIKTNQSGLTATVIGQNNTFEVPLDQQSGGTDYGVLSASRSTDIYLIRHDSGTATGLNDSIVEVVAE